MSARGVSFRPLGPADEREIVALWQACVGDRYPLRSRLWRQITIDNDEFRPTDVVVAVSDGGERGPGYPRRLGPIVGFGYLGRSHLPVRGRPAWADEGWLQVVAVTPGRQRQGIGRAIVERLLDGARADGLGKVGLGGGIHYLFPGVPADLIGARPFFAALGARFGHETYDVRGSLDGRSTTDHDRGALASAGLTARPMHASEGDELLAFIDREFALDWVHDQAWAMHHGMAPHDIVLLVPAGAPGLPVASEAMAGFATLHQRGNGPLFGPRFWEDLLEPSSGGLGPIGIVVPMRGRGLGRAFLAASLDMLHARGVRDCVIDWTTLLDFYGAFGFRPWKSYVEGELRL